MPNFTSFRLIEEEAEALLNEYQKGNSTSIEVPIPLERISLFLGLEIVVRNVPHPTGTVSGALIGNTIFVAENESSVRRRFSVAHEIGHKIISERTKKLYFGSKTKLESIMDRFAGALLVPRSLLQKEIEQYLYIDNTSIFELAKKFNVSPSAMLVRILYLLEHNIKFCRPIYEETLGDLKRQLLGKRRKIISYRQKSFNESELFYAPHDSPEIIMAINPFLTEMGLAAPRDKNGQLFYSPREVLGKPLIIEVAGTPNAGKDTQIEILLDYFKDVLGYRVKVINEGYRSCPITVAGNNSNSLIDKYDWAFHKLMSTLYEIKYQSLEDVIILNRGIFDSLAFLQLHEKENRLTSEQFSSRKGLLLEKNLTDLIDLVLVMKIPSNHSIVREQKETKLVVENLARKYSSTLLPENKINSNVVNKNTLNKLNKCYCDIYDTYKNQFKKVIVLKDLELKRKHEVSEEILDTILFELLSMEQSLELV